MMDRWIDRLDKSIDGCLRGRREVPTDNAPLRELLQVAEELQYVPRAAFRARLQEDLVGAILRRADCPERAQRVEAVGVAKPRCADYESVIPPLFTSGSGSLPIRGLHLALSFALHVLALALITASGWWMVENRAVVRRRVAQVVPSTADYLLPISPGKIGGGGGGGDHDIMAPSHGAPPRFASEQLTPPAAVVPNETPKLPAEPTVIALPDLVLSQPDQYGDPMAVVLAPLSNGTGRGGAIGTGKGTGIGVGNGPGVGEGEGGGIGGGVFHVGGGVSAPRPIYDPDPEYSDEARKAKYQGSILLLAVIGPDGRPRDLHVVRSLGMGLDQKALDAVWKWRFTPAMKDNRPVAVKIGIEVTFRLY